jgi:oligogalacturonide transport system substrate-binding protein
MPDTRYYASFGKSNMYEMKPWIQGEWAGYVELHHQQIFRQPEAAGEAGAGEYPMLPGATDAGLFFKPAQMLSIGKSTKNRKRRRK